MYFWYEGNEGMIDFLQHRTICEEFKDSIEEVFLDGMPIVLEEPSSKPIGARRF